MKNISQLQNQISQKYIFSTEEKLKITELQFNSVFFKSVILTIYLKIFFIRQFFECKILKQIFYKEKGKIVILFKSINSL